MDHHPNLIYLSVSDQKLLAKESSSAGLIQFNHFGRKNVGIFWGRAHPIQPLWKEEYLMAIMNCAVVIYNTDDNNKLVGNSLVYSSETASPDIVQVSTDALTYNPYRLFNPSLPVIWPRGLSLKYVKDIAFDKAKMDRPDQEVAPACAVQQLLADNNPDVDAIYRLMQPLPMHFSHPQPTCYAMPSRTFVPYNAQAMLHHYSMFWGLLIPMTVHWRV
jgi:hypothetical protein